MDGEYTTIKGHTNVDGTDIRAVDVQFADRTANGVAAGIPPLPPNTCCFLKYNEFHTVGPFLKFWGTEQKSPPGSGSTGSRTWKGSVLLVTQAQLEQVSVVFKDESDNVLRGVIQQREVIDEYRKWRALRFMLELPVFGTQHQVSYTVLIDGQPVKGNEQPHVVCIPGYKEKPHFGYYSCSGFSADVTPVVRGAHKDLKPLWDDVRLQHEKKPFHVLVGGGDQLYNDDVWECSTLKEGFLNMPLETSEQRLAKNTKEFTPEMEAQVNAYYFHHYAAHFSQDVIGKLYACIPQVMSWDDHDIFDGWGSHPPYLQKSHVFRGIFEAAVRWYCVFQQHCRVTDEKEKEKVLGVNVYELCESTAIVTCDQRYRRTRDQILPLEHYMHLSNLCNLVPKGLKHVVIVFTIPVVYPHIPCAGTVLSCAKNDCILRMLKCCGADPMSYFGEPELADDLDDHWTAPSHWEERRFLVEHLQLLAKFRECRVTLLSGDVHVCGAGYLETSPRPRNLEDIKHDFRYMVQVVSSAIGNPPPPGILMKVLDFFAGGKRINRDTKCKMYMPFKTKAGVRKPLQNKRNWCEVAEDMNGNLVFSLRVEMEPGEAATRVTKYDVKVVPYVHQKEAREEYHEEGKYSCYSGLCSKQAAQHNGVLSEGQVEDRQVRPQKTPSKSQLA